MPKKTDTKKNRRAATTGSVVPDTMPAESAAPARRRTAAPPVIPSEVVGDGMDAAALVRTFGDIAGLTPKQRTCGRKVLEAAMTRIADPIKSLNELILLLSLNPDPALRTCIFTRLVLEQLLVLFAYSSSLSRAIRKDPSLVKELFPIKKETPEDMASRLESCFENTSQTDSARALRLVKYREFIRIAVSDFMGYDDFTETTRKISLVADTCVLGAMHYSGLSTAPVAVIAMGKWGGMELNYSSDIDLLFVVADTISLENLGDIHARAARTVRLIDQVTADGFVFRVDNRLRPEGKTGSLVRTIRQYLDHYKSHALAWEFQALVKARVGAGDTSTGTAFIAKIRPLVYDWTVEPEAILVEVRNMKLKIETTLVARRQDKANVKLGIGGIRDIEFIVQFLQLHHGRVNSSLHEQNTVTAIDRLFTHRIITADEQDTLKREYVFLRELEHCLQIADELPIRQLPSDPIALNIIGRKMRLKRSGDGSTGDTLLRRYEASILKTRKIFHSFFALTIGFLEKKKRVRELCPDVEPTVIERHFNRLESDYYLTFPAEEIVQHVVMIVGLSNEHHCEMSVLQLTDKVWRVTIVANDYIGEFAKICGLFSVYGLNILSGESYTYGEPASKSSEAFYRRRTKKYATRTGKPGRNSPPDRKVVCVANLESGFGDGSREIDWAAFRRDLEDLLQLLHDGKFEIANERMTLRAIDAVRSRAGAPTDVKALKPIIFDVDNDSDQTYTILQIRSSDKFMFLFEFSNVLATRNYYIGKVEISTQDNEVRDRLFITTREGKKITSEKRLHRLRMTITLIKQFATFMPYAPNPQLALTQFCDFVDCILDAAPKGAATIPEPEAMLKDLARILGTSAFLWEDFLRMQHENLLPILVDAKKLDRSTSTQGLRRRLKRHLDHYPQDKKGQIACLNRFKDREMFRIDLRHLTRRVQRFTDFCRELSELADVVLAQAYKMAINMVSEEMGIEAPGISCLCAMGKWGGCEIGYGSDIEILFLWDNLDRPYHETVEFYNAVAQTIAGMIKSRQDGIFELDFRLRPGGKSSYLGTPLNHYLGYFSDSGRADPYERQALIRLRTLAGQLSICRKVSEHRRHYVFGPAPFDIERIMHLRQRQITELVKPNNINAKYSPGGLVDAEYFIQVLQILYGHRDPSIQSTNTMEAATALNQHHCLDDTRFMQVKEGYRFLRALINGLRIVRGNARDLVIPPPDSAEFRFLVRRLESFEHIPVTHDAWGYMTSQMHAVHNLFQSLATIGGEPCGGS